MVLEMEMGKRGPKKGQGGRPIEYHDEYHRVQRKKMRESRKRRKRKK